MDSDSDELTFAVRELQNDSASTAESVRDALIKALVSTAIPFGIGSALTNLLADTADQRWKARVSELLAMFAERVTKLADAIDSQDFYGSEEFQALVIEAIDQERTNRYEEKRAMLAQGLANSGTRAFAEDDTKETFFRILRDLSPKDIGLLRGLSRPTKSLHTGQHFNPATTERVSKAKAVNPRVYRLQGFGLVSTSQRLPAPKINGPRGIQDQGALNRFIADALAAEPDVVIRLTDFGNRFLMFLLGTASSASKSAGAASEPRVFD